jgi:hypothetical protein
VHGLRGFQLAILLIAVACAGCGSHRGELIYGAAPLPSLPPTATRSDKTGKQVDAGDLIRTFTEIARDDLLPCLPRDQQEIAKKIRVSVVRNNPTAFLMYSSIYKTGAGLQRTIYIGEVTWKNFAFASQARALIDKGVGIDERWVARYMLYIRKSSDFTNIPSPAAAAGILGQDGKISKLTDEQQNEVRAAAVMAAQRRTTFLLGHELYHHFYPLPSRSREAEVEYAEQQRIDEAKADRFGLKLTLCRTLIRRHLEDVSAAPLLFLDWILMMEGARRSLAPGTHPLDHSRAKAAASFLLEMVLKMPNASQDQELLGTYRQIISLADEIDNEGPSAYFSQINKESEEVNLASLKVTT